MDMCGFVAAIALAPDVPIDRHAVERATDLLVHRGPDAGSVVHSQQFSFGHRRLSIIDTGQRSGQPFTTEGATLIYNGEIYNFRDLKRGLMDKGVRFQTSGDTEVVLQAYLYWGDECVHHLNGIFAFVVYDQRKQRAFIARDHLGVKPVYYARHGDNFLVASEPKALAEFDRFGETPDPAVISAFLTFRYALETEQWIKGVNQLLPGHCISIEGGRPRLRQYWSADEVQQSNVRPEDYTDALSAAIEGQLVSDVPIGLLLSGGVDSSIVAFEASKAVRRGSCRPISSYTALFEEQARNEVGYAAEVAGQLAMPLHKVAINPRVSSSTVEKLVHCRDAPLGMHNEIAMYALALEARQSAKVLLCGEGADEALAGYTRLFRLPFDVQRMKCIAHMPAGLGQRLARALALPQTLPSDDAMSFFFTRYSYFSQSEKQALFHPEIWKAIDGDSRLWAAVGDRLKASTKRPLFDRITQFFVSLHLPGLLGMVDGTTMAASVEARVPFCDRRLMELALGLRQKDKLQWRSPLHCLVACLQPITQFSEQADYGKAVLRHAYRAKLPQQTLTRRKMGFSTPLGAWIWGPLAELRQEMLESSGSPLFSYFRKDPLPLWMESSRRGDDESSRKLWMLMTLGVHLLQLKRRSMIRAGAK
jgi:asparagine synthase (glutamine-hydrolysing)